MASYRVVFVGDASGGGEFCRGVGRWGKLCYGFGVGLVAGRFPSYPCGYHTDWVI